MFSPDAALPSVQNASSRNPRRRQRQYDSDSTRQQRQRKRSKLSDDLFDAPTTANGSHGMNGHASHGAKDAVPTLRSHSIPVREKRISSLVKRGEKGDGGTTFTKTANYTVKQLPGVPERLRGLKSESFRASSLPSTPYALALTHEHAFVWDYTSPVPSPTPHILTLPHPSKRTDPLPLGSVVTTGPPRDVGLVVVMPVSGRITYWENVDSAESLSLFQQRRPGIEGSAALMNRNETVTEIVDADRAGFVLLYSSGRIAQLTLRDSQGRPHINVQFLSGQGTNGGGWLGGWFSGSTFQGDVAAVRVRPSPTKGQMEVVSATGTGSFELWELSWSGQPVYKGKVNARSVITDSLKQGTVPEMGGQLENTKILDFTMLLGPTSKSTEVALVNARQSLGVIALVATPGGAKADYALVEVVFTGDTANVERVIPLHTYKQHGGEGSGWKPRLLVPHPGHTALVLFDRAIVIVSLAVRTANPESVKPLPPYQDTVYLRDDAKVEFTGCAVEGPHGKSKTSSCIVFTDSPDILRVAAFKPPTDGKDANRARVTAKSKIEQAIFFSAIPENVMDFSSRPVFEFSKEEVRKAAVEVSKGILASRSEFIPLVTMSMDEQLGVRADALRTLASHLKQHYPGSLDRDTKWQLLWDAEKVAAARGIWKTYDESLKTRDIKQRKLLTEVVEFMHERYKTPLDPEMGELDPVRQWFVKDLSNINILLPWAYHAIQELFDEGVKDRMSILILTKEAVDLYVVALETAFQFRKSHLDLYGLEQEKIDDGVLESGFEGLPEFWTSTYNIVNSLTKLVDFSRDLPVETYEKVQLDSSEAEIAREVAKPNHQLVKLCCLTHIERYRWCLAHEDEALRAQGRDIKLHFEEKVRPVQITRLLKLGQVSQAMDLAEKLRDMPTLVKLVHNETAFLNEFLVQATPGKLETLEQEKKARVLGARIKRYFAVFGDDWADALYSSYIHENRGGALFEETTFSQSHLTKFLRANRSRAKLRWINEVTGEKNFAEAGSALLDVARNQEPNAWCKKIELSLAKLSLLAAAENSQKPSSGNLASLQHQTTHQLRLTKVQEQLHAHIQPTVHGALDAESAVELLMDTYGKDIVHDKPAHQQLLRRGFEELLSHRAVSADLLIDVLTLMDQTYTEALEPGAVDIRGKEFLLALQALEYHCAASSSITASSGDATLKLIWKRCFIRDDWAAINNTVGKSGEVIEREVADTALFWTLKEGFKIALWDKTTTIRALQPAHVLGAGCDPNAPALRERFPAEELREPIAADNALDDEMLEEYLERCRLEHWYEVCSKAAIKSLHDEAEAEARRREAERERMGEGVDNRDREDEEDEEDGDEEEAAEEVDGDGYGEELEEGSERMTPGGFDGDDEESVVTDAMEE
ncbi:hypothetical protein W97_08083 [Coniosporium apollinis CBS 100218]|uniref:Nucleoporin Nup133/Nup155-like C-terminal domain-containing protein n=1 Tax=Coniosporium apollinis (strain CBS 100218) TaxID=1168221 RepID=R7Z3P9_CONA1|nr:uncharacterized protein W97_08083 [Coniosporium apollinis CBS 100218]EON68825.1 hypothetical protein W97_08083 [Coniosporium apollinis CBS 100218]